MKTVLITGATRGIGKASLLKFLKEGYNVIGTYNSSSKLADELMEEYPEKLRFFQYVQGNIESTKTLLEKIKDIDVDVLINNAGLGSKTVENVSSNKEEQDLELMKVNSVGALWITEKIISKMLNTNNACKIINISSVGGGIFHFPGFRLADGMSKAALTFMTKQMASEHVHTNIDIFAICPGATDTDMFNASTLDGLNNIEKKKLIVSMPKKRLISPDEIADLAYFLTTDSARVLHGAVLDSSLGLGVNPGMLGKNS